MIARAIVHQPKVLIFDEATSALDNKTQTSITESINRLKCTRIVIAHRLSTIKNADRIIMLEGGKITEQGDYQTLIEKEIDALIEENEFQSLVLDMTELRYMSSAGIRVVMRLKQQYGDVSLNNMPDDIYDIFLMVGLTNVFEIKRLSKK